MQVSGIQVGDTRISYGKRGFFSVESDCRVISSQKFSFFLITDLCGAQNSLTDRDFAQPRRPGRRRVVHHRHRERHHPHDAAGSPYKELIRDPVVEAGTYGPPSARRISAHEAQHDREDLPHAAERRAPHRDEQRAERSRAPTAGADACGIVAAERTN